MIEKNEIIVKPYSPAELSRLFGISDKTLRTWIRPIKKKIGQRYGRFYTVKQIEVLFNHFGLPHHSGNINRSMKSFNN